MTKKHFNDLANEMRLIRPLSDANKGDGTDALFAGRLDQWRRTVRSLAVFCGHHSKSFDRDVFMKACGYDNP